MTRAADEEDNMPTLGDSWPEFSRARPCQKCGNEKASIEYQAGGYASEERMVRKCTDCGFVWYERPVDRGGV